jgi:predicted nucleotidyltransferase
MHQSIERSRADIASICRRYGVHRLDVFGSAARSTDFDPNASDADFLVEFDASDSQTPLKQFFGLSESLHQLLGRSVDLIERGAIVNPYVLADVERARELVYAA